MRSKLLYLIVVLGIAASCQAQLEVYNLPMSNIKYSNYNNGNYIVTVGYAATTATVEVYSNSEENVLTAGSGSVSWVNNYYTVYTGATPPTNLYILWGESSASLSSILGGETPCAYGVTASVTNVTGNGALFNYPSLACSMWEKDDGGHLSGTGSASASNPTSYSTWTPTWTKTGTNTWQSNNVSIQMPAVTAGINNANITCPDLQATVIATVQMPFQISLTTD